MRTLQAAFVTGFLLLAPSYSFVGLEAQRAVQDRKESIEKPRPTAQKPATARPTTARPTVPPSCPFAAPAARKQAAGTAMSELSELVVSRKGPARDDMMRDAHSIADKASKVKDPKVKAEIVRHALSILALDARDNALAETPDATLETQERVQAVLLELLK